jgi:hypothetical protein
MKLQTNNTSDDILLAIAEPLHLSEGIDTDPLIVQASSSNLDLNLASDAIASSDDNPNRKSAAGFGKSSIWGLGGNDTPTGGWSALHNLYLANQLLLGLTN